jgi:hypothetical protein
MRDAYDGRLQSRLSQITFEGSATIAAAESDLSNDQKELQTAIYVQQEQILWKADE